MIWFTSDLHFYHRNIIKHCNRPFGTVEEMNETLVNNWNECIKDDDVVYCLGDFSLAERPVELYTPRLNGYKILIAGNHDLCHPSHKRAKTVEKMSNIRNKYHEYGWSGIRNTDFIMFEGRKVLMSHFPYKSAFTNERFHKFRLEDNNYPLLCGHIHNSWRSKRTDKGTLMINVGVDVWNYRPVSYDTLKNEFFT